MTHNNVTPMFPGDLPPAEELQRETLPLPGYYTGEEARFIYFLGCASGAAFTVLAAWLWSFFL